MNPSLPREFWEQLPLKADSELFEVLAHEGDYLPEAIAAVRQELSRRNLAPESAVRIQAAVQSQVSAEEKKAQERLSWPMRLFILFGVGCCVGVLPAVIVAAHYHHKGYKQKARDCWITFAGAFVILVILMVLAGLAGFL